MSVKKIIITVFLFFALFAGNSLSFNSGFINKLSAENLLSKNMDSREDEVYVLEFIDGSWWWVLYGPDGNVIQKIPFDF